MIVLGIDPGTSRMGYGVVKKDAGKISLVAAGILKIQKKPPEALSEIKNELIKIVKKFKPDKLAIEKLYFSKNQKTALSVAEARGVALLVGMDAGLKVEEYSPNEVKLGVAGYGFADKKSVLKMVRIILNEPGLRLIDDASDALALAILSTGRHTP